LCATKVLLVFYAVAYEARGLKLPAGLRSFEDSSQTKDG